MAILGLHGPGGGLESARLYASLFPVGPLDTISFTDTGTDRALIVRRGLSSGSLAAAQLSFFLSKCSWQWHTLSTSSDCWLNFPKSHVLADSGIDDGVQQAIIVT